MTAQQWNPGKLLEVSGSYWETCVLHAAVKVDLFTALGDEQLAAEDISQKLKVDKRALSMLLNALVAMNLLSKVGDKYSNSSASLSFLSKDSPDYIGYMIMHHHHLMDSWSQLDLAVKKGKPVRTRASFSDKEVREGFIMGMFNLARGLAPRVAKEIDLSDRRHLLDLGGGPGTYAIYFCLNNPELNATVFDLPTTRPFAEKTIEKYDLADRIDFIGGDYLEDDIKGSYDVAWLSHILHGEGPESCRTIIQKAVSALEPGGRIIIHDFILDNTMDGPLFPAIFSLNMLLGTTHGQSYSEEQIFEFLVDSGIKEIQRIPFQGPNDSGIVIGIVQ